MVHVPVPSNLIEEDPNLTNHMVMMQSAANIVQNFMAPVTIPILVVLGALGAIDCVVALTAAGTGTHQTADQEGVRLLLLRKTWPSLENGKHAAAPSDQNDTPVTDLADTSLFNAHASAI
ncbi:hypothetical protein B0H66DRAFT_635211 [Apodospora peruviana]|uniref:Uncharacterized protein n=1 Tax=Apodospora peruviana TaxID=516989 RepID=A0AAE0IRT6_9PEZI|nr:hypothetical protein B0H66DRAFT_635211 [Apodospora peruviana]